MTGRVVFLRPNPWHCHGLTFRVLEGLAALNFKTGPWNSFKPHGFHKFHLFHLFQMATILPMS